MSKTTNYYIAAGFVVLLLIGLVLYLCHARFNDGYEKGYDAGYSAGYAEANRLAEEKPKADAVTTQTKTETKIVYQKVPYTGTDVQIRTEEPKVTVKVNGKETSVKQKTETADLAVKTETAISVKVPERRWSVGIGTDGHKAVYMLKVPIRGAVGAWASGNRDMGGLTISF